jgi:hypothetical protein
MEFGVLKGASAWIRVSIGRELEALGYGPTLDSYLP